MIDRRRLRRIFLSAFRSGGLDYVGGGAQITHPDLTWTLSLILDGVGASAPYRLVLGASRAQLGREAPRVAQDCYLFLPLGWGDEQPPGAPPVMPEAAFPEWPGSVDDRVAVINAVVDAVSTYAEGVRSLRHLRSRYLAGDFAGAFIVAPMRSLLTASE